MLQRLSQPTSVALIFIWIGFVCAISFMEAWLKFKAPGVDLPTGLGIGRIVFHALNKVEWVAGVLIILLQFIPQNRKLATSHILFFAALLILILQTFWWLPRLDQRAILIMQNQSVPESLLHFIYIGSEFCKVILLLIVGFLWVNDIPPRRGGRDIPSRPG